MVQNNNSKEKVHSSNYLIQNNGSPQATHNNASTLTCNNEFPSLHHIPIFTFHPWCVVNHLTVQKSLYQLQRQGIEHNYDNPIVFNHQSHVRIILLQATTESKATVELKNKNQLSSSEYDSLDTLSAFVCIPTSFYVNYFNCFRNIKSKNNNDHCHPIQNAYPSLSLVLAKPSVLRNILILIFMYFNVAARISYLHDRTFVNK